MFTTYFVVVCGLVLNVARKYFIFVSGTIYLCYTGREKLNVKDMNQNNLYDFKSH